MRSIVIGAILLMAAQGWASEYSEYLVKYRHMKARGEILQMAAQKSAGLDLVDEHAPGSYVVVAMDDSSAASLSLARLEKNAGVEWIVPNFKLHAVDQVPTDLTLRPQWAMDKVRAAAAWERAGNRGSKNVIVAVIDTGVDYRHRNLVGNMVPGYDFHGKDEDPMDETSARQAGHGTHCGGVIAADGLIEGGTVGMAPNVSLMPIRFLDSNGSGDLNNGIKSIDFAIEKGASVISASWGAAISESKAKAMIEAVKRASDAGVIFVVAAANNGKSNDRTDIYPANATFENTIAVAASNANDGKPSWSNFGKGRIHLSSPGEGIMSTLPGDKYGNMSGTSMATPLVAGLVGFLKSQDPTLTGAQIRALMQTTGAKVDIETACNCRIDAFAAVDHLLEKKMWMVPAAATLEDNVPMTLQVMNAQGPVTFASSNPAIVSVDEKGVVSAMGKGSARITVTDGNGRTVTSSDFHSNKRGSGNPPGRVECPIGSPRLCEAVCRIFPSRSYCQKP